jgi:cytochrome P450
MASREIVHKQIPIFPSPHTPHGDDHISSAFYGICLTFGWFILFKMATLEFLTMYGVFTLLLLAAIGVITFTHIFTRLQYSYQLSRLLSPRTASERDDGKAGAPQLFVPAPQIPYSIPFLGNARDFLAPKPGMFWRQLFRSYPRLEAGCTLLLGGQTTHVLFDETAIQALFKARNPTRDKFNDQVMINALGCSRPENDLFWGHNEGIMIDERGKNDSAKRRQAKIFEDYLLKADSVNELTREFTSRLSTQFAESNASEGKEVEVEIADWLRRQMFRASTIALLGSRILDPDNYPELVNDFWEFDQYFLSLFFGLPKVMLRKEHEILDKSIAGIQKWRLAMEKETAGKIFVDPHTGPHWEPTYGSRANRARQLFYSERGINEYTCAAADLGFLFGLSSNAIPTAGWMLMHIFDPKSQLKLHERLMEELMPVRNEDGSLDIPKLICLPLLQAVFHEILRLYADILVTRILPEDLSLPLADGKRIMTFRKGATVMAPSYVAHRDQNAWVQDPSDAPAESFYPDRFLRSDPETGAKTFTLMGTVGKFFPFGGGKTICPGRVFAKQEVLAAVALVLLGFAIKSVGCVDVNGKPIDKFPSIRDGMGGSGVIVMNGDVKVRMKKR